MYVMQYEFFMKLGYVILYKIKLNFTKNYNQF